MAEKKDALKPHKFWDTQPVPKLGTPEAEIGDVGSIEEKILTDVQVEPYSIPDSFEWFNPDVTDAETMLQIYDLLAEHYVEDDDSMFRFAYPTEFLLWALTPPGWIRDWHVGVRVKATGKMVGFISGVPASIRVGTNTVPMCEINFLCAHKKVRSKRLAPTLIKEVTRRVNLKGVWQAVYTAGIVLPRPIAKCQYWHRSLNPPKLISIGFSRVPPNFTKFKNPMEATKRHYRLPSKTVTPGLRPMEEKDVAQVTTLLSGYLQKFPLAPSLDEADVAHWLLPRPNVIDSFVVENTAGKLTDFLSFYTLPSTIIGHPKHDLLKAAYSYYNVCCTVPQQQLMGDALILAHQRDFDVFNALDIMDNSTFLKELKFGIGDGHLQYYLFNWRCPDVTPDQVGLVML